MLWVVVGVCALLFVIVCCCCLVFTSYFRWLLLGGACCGLSFVGVCCCRMGVVRVSSLVVAGLLVLLFAVWTSLSVFVVPGVMRCLLLDVVVVVCLCFVNIVVGLRVLSVLLSALLRVVCCCRLLCDVVCWRCWLMFVVDVCCCVAWCCLLCVV